MLKYGAHLSSTTLPTGAALERVFLADMDAATATAMRLKLGRASARRAERIAAGPRLVEGAERIR